MAIQQLSVDVSTVDAAPARAPPVSFFCLENDRQRELQCTLSSARYFRGSTSRLAIRRVSSRCNSIMFNSRGVCC